MKNQKKKSRKSKNENIHESAKERLSDGITTACLLYMGVFFPLVMHDGYLDITLTRFRLFEAGVIAYVILTCLAGVLWPLNKDGTVPSKSHKQIRKSDRHLTKKNGGLYLMASDLWMLFFLLSGVTAWLLSDNRTSAFTGEEGRRCGFAFILLAVLLYVCMGRGYRMRSWLLPITAIVSDVCFLMSVLQHLNVDVFYLLSQIQESERSVFISTFGNINIYASFVSMAVVFLIGVSLTESDIRLRRLYGVSVFFAGAAALAANSDGVYIGLFAGLLVLFIFAVYQERLLSFLTSVWLLFLGYTCMSAVTTLTKCGAEKLTGIATCSKYWYVLLGIAVFWTAFLYGGTRYKRSGQSIETDRNGRIVFWTLAAIGMLCILICGIGSVRKWDFFTFDDTWGDYRGYIWTRLCRIYRELPFVNQIFGAGQESIYALMSKDYAEEMIQVTGTIYDSAHNEYLQYLVTMGACGLIAYLGILVSSVQNSVRLAKNSRMGVPLAASILAYAAQSSVNVEQPITTPFLFLGVALAAGLYRKTLSEETSFS